MLSLLQRADAKRCNDNKAAHLKPVMNRSDSAWGMRALVICISTDCPHMHSAAHTSLVLQTCVSAIKRTWDWLGMDHYRQWISLPHVINDGYKYHSGVTQMWKDVLTVYCLTLPFYRICILLLSMHVCGEEMATEVTEYNNPTLWRFFKFVLLCDKMSFPCISHCSFSQPQSEWPMGARTALIHCEPFSIREGVCRREDHEREVGEQSSMSL